MPHIQQIVKSLLVEHEQRAHLFHFQWDSVIPHSLCPLRLSSVSPKPFSHLFFDTLIPVSIFSLSSPFIHLVLWPQLFHPSIFYSSPSLLLFYSVTPSPPPLTAPPVIKAPNPLMVGKAHRLSWSASGFTVSSSDNVTRAICAHTHTYKNTKQISPSLRQTATSDGLFPSMDYVWRFTSLQPPSLPLYAPCLPEWFPMSYWAISRGMDLCICVSESICVYKCACISLCVCLYEGRGVKAVSYRLTQADIWHRPVVLQLCFTSIRLGTVRQHQVLRANTCTHIHTHKLMGLVWMRWALVYPSGNGVYIILNYATAFDLNWWCTLMHIHKLAQHKRPHNYTVLNRGGHSLRIKHTHTLNHIMSKYFMQWVHHKDINFTPEIKYTNPNPHTHTPLHIHRNTYKYSYMSPCNHKK